MSTSVITLEAMPQTTISDRIRAILEKHGWSQRELAKRAQLQSNSHINVLLRRNGEGVSVGTMRKIADAAGVRLEWLMSGEGEEQPDGSASVSEPSPSHDIEIAADPRFGSLRSWPALLKGARSLRPSYPQWVWMRLEDMTPQLVADPTVATVVKLSDLIAENETPPPSDEDPRAFWADLMARKRLAALKKMG